MSQYQIVCGSCQKTLKFPEASLGKQAKCTGCGTVIALTSPPAESVAAKWEAPAAATPPASSGSARMKANKVVAGTSCLACEQQIQIGEDIYNCPACKTVQHAACYDSTGCCANSDCAESKPTLAGGAPVAAEMPDGHVPCKMCGEPIRSGAKKCRFCGEFQGKAMQRARGKGSKGRGASDDNLSVMEIVLCIFCAGIACIVGLVYGLQGKKKGWKMVLISLAAAAVWTAIRVAIESSAGR
ncbi:RING finger protein [Planctomycetota bacterium]